MDQASFVIGILLVLQAGMVGILLSNLAYLRRRPAASDTPLPRLSVLIPARNEENNLSRLLPSLIRQDYPDFEVLVYDDGSEDGTWEVIHSVGDTRIRGIRGSGPPAGWIGKVHALYQLTRQATGDVYLFLDADTELVHPSALRRLATRYASLPPSSVLTGMARFTGGGLLLVSMVPVAILCGLPWVLVRPVRTASLGALNGQCWMIAADLYHAHEPHEHFPDEVLEDVRIGRYLKSRGVVPVLVDLVHDVDVHMYESFPEAWRGFRKNAYLIMGGHPITFLLTLGLFAAVFLIAPSLSPWMFGLAWAAKAVSDRRVRMPLWVSALVPVSYLLAVALALDSAVSHWTGRVTWKGRRV